MARIVTVENDDLTAYVKEVFEQYDVRSSDIVFEITESLAVRRPLQVDRQIATLRDLGCQFALDDFGTGYSSFSYLQKLQFDYIKIDGTFVQDLPNNPVDQKMIKLIAEVGRWPEPQGLATVVGVYAVSAQLAAQLRRARGAKGQEAAERRERDVGRAFHELRLGIEAVDTVGEDLKLVLADLAQQLDAELLLAEEVEYRRRAVVAGRFEGRPGKAEGTLAVDDGLDHRDRSAAADLERDAHDRFLEFDLFRKELERRLGLRLRRGGRQ